MTAKAKNLNALASGMLGEVQTDGTNNAISSETENDLQAFRERQRTTEELIKEFGLELTDEQRKALVYRRARMTGRQPGTKNGQRKPAGHRATFIVSKEIVRKMKYIALVEEKTFTAVVSEILLKGIAEFEASHGTINI